MDTVPAKKQPMQSNVLIIMVIGVIALLAATAAAATYITKEHLEQKTPVKEKIIAKKSTQKEQVVWNNRAEQPTSRQVTSCDDGNIVGTAIGAAAGGIAGNQLGKGKGKDLATIGGAIAGGYAGHEMIPTRNTLCR